MVHKLDRKQKSTKLKFILHGCNPIHSQTRFIGLFVRNVCNLYIGVPQKPRDHLFQKSGHLGLTGCINRKHTKIDKFDGFLFMIVTKYLTRWVLRVHLVTLCEIHHNGIIQNPHDHLF